MIEYWMDIDNGPADILNKYSVIVFIRQADGPLNIEWTVTISQADGRLYSINVGDGQADG